MPNDNAIQMILSGLARIEAKVDEQARKLSEFNERLTKMEVKQEMQESVNHKVDELYSIKDTGMGIKQMAAWLVATGLAVAGLILK